jgi:hypothetical protein
MNLEQQLQEATLRKARQEDHSRREAQKQQDRVRSRFERTPPPKDGSFRQRRKKKPEREQEEFVEKFEFVGEVTASTYIFVSDRQRKKTKLAARLLDPAPTLLREVAAALRYYAHSHPEQSPELTF